MIIDLEKIRLSLAEQTFSDYDGLMINPKNFYYHSKK